MSDDTVKGTCQICKAQVDADKTFPYLANRHEAADPKHMENGARGEDGSFLDKACRGSGRPVQVDIVAMAPAIFASMPRR